ncbi:uncharacterized protein LOC144152696 isoform X2 [Haemaphysalis longicornis]
MADSKSGSGSRQQWIYKIASHARRLPASLRELRHGRPTTPASSPGHHATSTPESPEYLRGRLAELDNVDQEFELFAVATYLNQQPKEGTVKYLGHVLTRDGPSLDPDRLHDILQVQAPSNKKELQNFLDKRLMQVREETAKDPIMLQLHHYARISWPGNKNDVIPDLRSYWAFREELHTQVSGATTHGEVD